MALQTPALAHGELSPKFISTLHEGTLVSRDAVIVTVTFWPTVAVGDALRVIASEIDVIIIIEDRIMISIAKYFVLLLFISPPQKENGTDVASTRNSINSSLLDLE
jgi:hypothetical protein